MRRSLVALLVVCAASLLAACQAGGGSSGLTGTTWYLTAGTETDPPWQWAVPVGEQANFTITFNTDGTISAKADCNQVSGTYETSGSNGLTIEPGAMTMAYCGAQSLDTLFVHALSTTETWAIDDGLLTLTLDDGGTLTFTSTAPTATPEPAGSPAEVPVGEVSGQGLIDREWQLTAVTQQVPAFQGVVPEAEQERYTIQFAEDGTFTATADCNTVIGNFETEDPAASSGPLDITPGPMTLVACPEGSFGDLFVVGLSSATSYAIADDVLTLTLVDDGTMQFR